MIHRIANIATAGAASNSYFYSGGTVSHLLIGLSVAPGTTDFITVTVNSPNHEPWVLYNRIRLDVLAEVSDIEEGASAVLQTLLNSVGASDYIGWFVELDLGCIHCQATGSTLEIQIEAGQAFTQGTLSALNLRPNEPEYAIKMSQSSLLVSSADMCDRIYITYPTGTLVPFTDAALNDLQVEIHSDHGDRFCTIQDCVAFTALFGEVEAQAPQRVFVAYVDTEELNGLVSYTISGSDADPTKINIIARMKLREEVGTAQSVYKALGIQEANLMSQSDSVQNALVTAGKSLPANIIRQTRDAVNAKLKAALARRGRNLPARG